MCDQLYDSRFDKTAKILMVNVHSVYVQIINQDTFLTDSMLGIVGNSLPFFFWSHESALLIRHHALGRTTPASFCRSCWNGLIRTSRYYRRWTIFMYSFHTCDVCTID
ncbi:hypothetical protein M758_1G312400 [Ceratodon purpureus]|uniref:Uncharacterized protein n=1 Tax=Ceratodon purpureus TaxID=3225 RepID=A0A8T0JBL4_CERPU|nr:hypothetical protein KC19_1G319300 [Ceratodon purpureus]KAG0632218.1 hypothetical protein M758_1G312400 [Ceratodon purpureus]